MILIFSDLHLGRDPALDEELLDDLRTCIAHYSSHQPELIFLGDTFDAYVDYPGRVPSIVTAWLDVVRAADLAFTYVPGNHDRWHGKTFAKSLDVPVHGAPIERSIQDKRVHLSHGDEACRTSPGKNALWHLLGHPLSLKAYTLALPMGRGMDLAAWVSRKYSRHEPEENTVAALKAEAVRPLEGEVDIVVLGHCHQEECVRMAGGVYMNTGSWYANRSFGVIRALPRPSGGEAVVHAQLNLWGGRFAQPITDLSV